MVWAAVCSVLLLCHGWTFLGDCFYGVFVTVISVLYSGDSFSGGSLLRRRFGSDEVVVGVRDGRLGCWCCGEELRW
ncbi:hypothetical protein P8452_09136 [Trifolium repens]|nr:hypothetical protein P8452_09136 [Trifolium repens]